MKLLSTEEDKIVTDGMLKFESVVQPYPPVVLLFDRKQDEDEDDDDDDEEGDTTTNKEEEERSEEEEEEPQQYIRTIKPYPYTYRTYAKRRWLGRTILDIYSTDYASYPISYYIVAIEQGRIAVNNTKVTVQYTIIDGDEISHTIIQHEPSVLISNPVAPYMTIVAETENFVIVDKPSTIPVHPKGSYNYQSIVSMLVAHYQHQHQQQQQQQQQKEQQQPPQCGVDTVTTSSANNNTKININTTSSRSRKSAPVPPSVPKLYPVHRLDRLTSGLVILGKNPATAKLFGNCILQKTGASCQKYYVARVRGQFPMVLPQSQSRLQPMLTREQYQLHDTTLPMYGEWQQQQHHQRQPYHNTQDVTTEQDEKVFSSSLSSSINKKKKKETNRNDSRSNTKQAGQFEEDDVDEDSQHRIAALRNQHAHVYWIGNEHGIPIFPKNNHNNTNKNDNDDDNDAADDISSITPLLEQVFQCRHSVDDWLATSNTNTTNDSNYCTRTATNHTETEEQQPPSPFLWFHITCPTRIVQHCDGGCETGTFDTLADAVYEQTVKASHSSFGVVSYDTRTDSTLLICRPYTGRSHQLRLHLQYLGHPIANDMKYGGLIWYNNPLGREHCMLAQKQLNTFHNASTISSSSNNVSYNTNTDNHATDTTAVTDIEVKNGIMSSSQGKDESLDDFIRRTCVRSVQSRSRHRERNSVVSDDDDNNDFDVDRSILELCTQSPGIWLHALQYTFETTNNSTTSSTTRISTDNNNDSNTMIKTCFRTKLPKWAISHNDS